MLRKFKRAVTDFLWFHASYSAYFKIRCVLSSNFRNGLRKAREESERNFLSKITDRGGGKVRIAFLCQHPTVWNSIKSVYLAAKNDPDVECILLTLPEKLIHENYSVNHEEYESSNRAYEMCIRDFKDTINAYDYGSGKWFDIESFAPDYVFLPTPYDIQRPPQYRSTELKTYTKVCFITYAHGTPKWADKMTYNMDFMPNVSFVFAESQDVADNLSKAQEFLRFPNLSIAFLGFPRYDLYKNFSDTARDSRFSKTVMWLPRWTTNDFVEKTTFFKYKDAIISYFLEHKDLKLICRPHPLMLRNFLSTGEMTQEEVDSFLKIFADNENLTYNSNGDYIPSLEEADIFISDVTSLLFEEFITGKPIIFLGKKERFGADAQRISSFFYHAKNQQQIFSHLEGLLSGNDPTKQERQEYIGHEMKVDYQSGERIIDFLKKDFELGQQG